MSQVRNQNFDESKKTSHQQLEEDECGGGRGGRMMPELSKSAHSKEELEALGQSIINELNNKRQKDMELIAKRLEDLKQLIDSYCQTLGERIKEQFDQSTQSMQPIFETIRNQLEESEQLEQELNAFNEMVRTIYNTMAGAMKLKK